MKVPIPELGDDRKLSRRTLADRLREAYRLLRDDEKIRTAAGAIVLLGLAVFAVGGLKGILLLGGVLLVAAALPSVRQRIRRWYLLG